MSEANQNQDLLPSGAASSEEDFDTQWQKFMSHDFGEFDDTPPAGESTTAAASGSDTISGNAGADTIAAAAGDDSKSSSAGADSAAAPASGNAPAGEAGKDAVPTVDPRLFAAMLGLGEEPKPAEGSPAAPAASGATPNASGDGTRKDDAEFFMPFKPEFRLQPEMVTALFESEDSATREKALVNLLSAFGNTITASMHQWFDGQMKERYQPELMTNFVQVQEQQAVGAAINNDFYGNFPELAEHKKVVKKAFDVVFGALGNKPYTEEVRNQVGMLARQTLLHAGIQLPERGTKPQATPSAEKKPVPKKAGVFEAGSTRPDGGGVDDGPAALVDELSRWA